MQINRPIIIAIILFSAIIFSFFWTAPEYRTFKNLRQELGEKRAEFNAQYDYFSAVAKAYNELESKKDGLRKIDDALPEDPNMGLLVYFFHSKALENGIILNNVFLSKSSLVNPQEKIKEVVFSLNLKGSYSSLENFIASLQKSARLFEITSISFNYGNQSPAASSPNGSSQNILPQSAGIYSFNMEVKTFSY